MEYKVRKRNTPIATLIKYYQDKKSGKVVKSRREIQYRFEYLEWKDQKKILMAFLQSGMTDRKWSLFNLLSYWDKSFAPIIEELWLKYHEREVAWVIIRFFPIDYVKQNMDTLGAGHNYQDICIRLYGEEDFEMDESRLDEVELLNIYSRTGQSITNEKAMEMLMTLVEKICTDVYRDWGYSWNYHLEACISSIKESNLVKRALSILKKEGKDSVVSDFLRWNETVLQDEEYNSKMLGVAHFFDNENMAYNFRLSKECYLKHLKKAKEISIKTIKEEYEEQKDYLEKTQEQHPSVKKLIRKYKLEIDGDLPF